MWRQIGRRTMRIASRATSPEKTMQALRFSQVSRLDACDAHGLDSARIQVQSMWAGDIQLAYLARRCAAPFLPRKSYSRPASCGLAGSLDVLESRSGLTASCAAPPRIEANCI